MPRGRPFKPGEVANPNGRPKGTPNKATLEIKKFARSIVEDKEYRANLKKRMIAGKEHPAIATLIFHYAYGKPKEHVEIDATGTILELIRQASRNHEDEGT